MRRTSRLILLLGIFLAALTFVVIIVLFNGGGTIGGPAVTAPPTDRAVVVATVDIPLGTLVTADMVKAQTMSLTVAKATAFSDPSQVIGQTNKQAITAGEQVTSDQFTSAGAGATLVVPPGKRAFSISVNELTGVANLINIGDYVDVLITERITVVQKNPDGSVATVPGLADAATVKMPLLLQEIQVIGTVDAVAAAPQGAPAASAEPTITGQSKLLILALTPEQAEVMLFARTSGTIDVVLRAPQDTGQTAVTDGVILKTLIDKYGVLPPNVIIVSVP